MINAQHMDGAMLTVSVDKTLIDGIWCQDIYSFFNEIIL
jgi:hypothetical protein